MNRLSIEINKAKEIAIEMENSLSYFKTFINNMERHVASLDSKLQTPEPQTVPIGLGVANDTPKPETYTIKTLAAEIGVSERTVRRYCNEGLVGYMHIRGKIRFSRSDVEAFYRDHYREKF